jgi:hypothetical protein
MSLTRFVIPIALILITLTILWWRREPDAPPRRHESRQPDVAANGIENAPMPVHKILTSRRASKTFEPESETLESESGSAQSSFPVERSQQIEIAREMASAACQGNLVVLDQLAQLRQSIEESLVTEVSGTSWEQYVARTNGMAPIKLAFDLITSEAVKANQHALDAISRSAETEHLQDYAIIALGQLARRGNESALDMLLDPGMFDARLSPSVVGALSGAAIAGNEKAVDGLAAAVANDTRGLWRFGMGGLTAAAVKGNDPATHALIRLAESSERDAQHRAIDALRQAAASQNVKAIEALRARGIE